MSVLPVLSTEVLEPDGPAPADDRGLFDAAPPTPDDAAGKLLQRLRGHALRDDVAPTSLERCLCTLLLAIEPTMPVERVLDAMPARIDDLRMPEFLNIMINVGYRARSTTVAPCDIDRRLLPCLIAPSSGSAEAVVVLAVQETEAEDVLTVYDGAAGRTLQWAMTSPQAQRARQVYFFSATSQEEDPTSVVAREHTGKTWFGAVLRRFNGSFLQLGALGLTLSMVSLGTPLFIMLVYDRVIAPRNSEPLSYLAVGVALSIAMEWLLRSLRTYSVSWLTARLDYLVGVEIFHRLIKLPSSLVERAPIAAQVARIKTFESVRDFFNGPVFLSLVELPSILVSIAAIAWFAGYLALVPMVVSLAYVALFLVLRRYAFAAIRHAARATSSTQKFTIETFDKLETIRVNGLSSAWGEKFRQLSGRENHKLFQMYYVAAVGEAIAHFLTLIAAISTLSFGVHEIWRGDMTAGILVACMILTWRVLSPFHSLCSTILRFEQLRAAVEQIDNLMDIATEEERDTVSARLPTINGRVSFTNVSLRFSRETGPLFLGLNAKIRPGELVVVTGANGSGKSSLLKMIMGLCSPLTGAVRVDGFDIRQLVQHDLRRLIAYVPQNPGFVYGTIADNLRAAKPFASEADLWRILGEVGAADEVAALRDGLDTAVGYEATQRLSSTLLYRIAFARALLVDSSLLLIDEQPNAALNAGLADLLRDVLRASRGTRTVIFVSYRHDLAQMADRAITLRPGQPPRVATIEKGLREAV